MGLGFPRLSVMPSTVANGKILHVFDRPLMFSRMYDSYVVFRDSCATRAIGLSTIRSQPH
jgi:hypothetical protein